MSWSSVKYKLIFKLACMQGCTVHYSISCTTVYLVIQYSTLAKFSIDYRGEYTTVKSCTHLKIAPPPPPKKTTHKTSKNYYNSLQIKKNKIPKKYLNIQQDFRNPRSLVHFFAAIQPSNIYYTWFTHLKCLRSSRLPTSIPLLNVDNNRWLYTD